MGYLHLETHSLGSFGLIDWGQFEPHQLMPKADH
ncbi:Uncharacterised protein [Vibrio cholerae]|nr:Uncharacterised protein [Vibrio cholerae]